MDGCVFDFVATGDDKGDDNFLNLFLSPVKEDEPEEVCFDKEYNGVVGEDGAL